MRRRSAGRAAQSMVLCFARWASAALVARQSKRGRLVALGERGARGAEAPGVRTLPWPKLAAAGPAGLASQASHRARDDLCITATHCVTPPALLPFVLSGHSTWLAPPQAPSSACALATRERAPARRRARADLVTSARATPSAASASPLVATRTGSTTRFVTPCARTLFATASTACACTTHVSLSMRSAHAHVSLSTETSMSSQVGTALLRPQAAASLGPGEGEAGGKGYRG